MNRVIKTTGTIKPKTTPLISKIFSPNDITNMDPVKWGKLDEAVALKEFLMTEATNDRNFKLNKCGLFLEHKKPYIGASPDAVASCKCHGFCVVEIKCPFNIRDKLITENVSEYSFLELNEMGNIQLKRSHKCFTQVISQIALAKAQLCYFVVWTSKDLIIELIKSNDTHYQHVERSLSIFFRRYICPILLGYKKLSFCAKLKKGKMKLIIIASSVISVMCWYHYKCQALQLQDAEALGDNWYYSFYKVPGRQHLTIHFNPLLLLCRNQSTDLLYKSTHRFLYNNTGLKWVKTVFST